MEEQIVIVGYKPRADKTEALRHLMRKHHSVLKELDLVTDRLPIIMEAKDGTIIEVFEWKSKAAIEKAHTYSEVLAMWKEYSEACEYIPVSKIEETSNLFATFIPFV